MRIILIAPRFDYELHEFLSKKFNGDAEVSVIRDRRTNQRRKRPGMREQDRRRKDRRRIDRAYVGFLVSVKETKLDGEGPRGGRSRATAN
jgi:hypothetical protein